MLYNRIFIRFFLAVLCLSGILGIQANKANAQRKTSKKYTLILDPGHGGHDPGAISNGLREKDVVLKVGTMAGKMIEQRHPDVRVLFTRNTDRFIGLQQRCNFANDNKGDVFMSIHCNSAGSRSARGSETYVLGLEKFNQNLGVAMKENKAMLLEDDYKTTYRGFDPTSSESYIMFSMIQNRFLDQSIYLAESIENNFRSKRPSRGVRQNVFWVQVYSAMPSVLIELGFLSNKEEAGYLGSEKGQREVARDIANAFSRYYSRFMNKEAKQVAGETAVEELETPREETPEQTIDNQEEGEAAESTVDTPKKTAEKEIKKEKAPEKGIRYRVQFMASKKKIPINSKEFSGIRQKITRDQGQSIYRYMAGDTGSLKEAKQLCRQIRKKHPKAFIVVYKGGKRTQEIYNL